MIKRILVICLLGAFVTQNANAWAWWFLRPLITNVAKQATKQGVKKTLRKEIVKSAVTGATIVSLTSIGNAKETDFFYNEHGAQLYENGHIIYVGKSCDVVSPIYGRGYWAWNENGWIIGVENAEQVTYFEYSYDNLPNFTSSIMNSCKLEA